MAYYYYSHFGYAISSARLLYEITVAYCTLDVCLLCCIADTTLGATFQSEFDASSSDTAILTSPSFLATPGDCVSVKYSMSSYAMSLQLMLVTNNNVVQNVTKYNNGRLASISFSVAGPATLSVIASKQYNIISTSYVVQISKVDVIPSSSCVSRG